jgi:hypothetical protein
MTPDPNDNAILDYASAPRRRRLAEIVDVELWAAVGVVVALLAADVACIIILLPG